MTKQEAIDLLQQDPDAEVIFSSRPGVEFEFTHYHVWLDDEGTLVYRHPTDPGRGPIEAPDTNYTRADRA